MHSLRSMISFHGNLLNCRSQTRGFLQNTSSHHRRLPQPRSTQVMMKIRIRSLRDIDEVFRIGKIVTRYRA
jgi:hypothetical protein